MRSGKKYTLYIILILIMLIHPVMGQDEDDQTSRVDFSEGVVFEVVPHTGFMGSSGIIGLKLGMNYGTLAFEFAVEQVIGKTSNLYPITVNAILNLTTHGKLIPYGIVGPALFITVPTNTVGDETITTAGLNFGGGLRYYFTSAFGLRLEAKQYLTTVENKRDNRNEILIFQEISIGASFLFK